MDDRQRYGSAGELEPGPDGDEATRLVRFGQVDEVLNAAQVDDRQAAWLAELRAERDAPIVTESELRLMWGDR